MFANSVKRLPFWVVIAIAFGVLAFVTWVSHVHVEARQDVSLPYDLGAKAPLEQCAGTDLQVQDISIEPNPPLSDRVYNVYVGITNGGNVTCTETILVYLYLDRDAVGDPDYQTIANTNGLGYNQVVTANLSVSGEDATQGYHWIRVKVDATDLITGECGGEDNNVGDETFDIISGEPTPTLTPVPTSTPFPTPQIYLFTPENATITRGESVSLHWQVYGESVSVYLDGELVSMEDTWEVYPEEDHIYTLRAENPGGYVEETSQITVLAPPTATPTITPTPCATPVIHYFDATSDAIYRGEEVTLFWDLAGADEAYLNGKGVPGVSEKTVTLNKTTTFTLLARNDCGDAEETLTIDVLYATPTNTPKPTHTSTPTRTPTATRKPVHTPTPNVLPSLTPTPNGTVTPSPDNTITPNVTRTPSTPMPTSTQSAFDSPIGTPTSTPTDIPDGTPTDVPEGTPTYTVTLTSTQVATLSTELTPTMTPSVTATPSATATVSALVTPEKTATITFTLTTTAAVVAQNVTPTAVPQTASPTPSPTTIPATGTMRMYLCPLAVLLVFAIGVIVLSLVLPRIRSRRDAQAAYTPVIQDTVFNPDDPLSERDAPVDTLSSPFADDEFASLTPKSASLEETEHILPSSAGNDGASTDDASSNGVMLPDEPQIVSTPPMYDDPVA